MSDEMLTRSLRPKLYYRNHVDQLTCFRCGEKIRLGDRVRTNGNNMYVSIKPNRLKSMRIHHQN